VPNHIVGEVHSPRRNHRPDVRAITSKTFAASFAPQDCLMTHASRRHKLLEPIAPFDELCPIGVGNPNSSPIM